MGASVQFHGKDAVLKAFDNKKIYRWAFFSGRQLLHKYEDGDAEESAQELTEWIEMISDSTNAVYTLRFYDDPPGGKINDRTPCDASFNFRLDMDGQGLNVGQYKHAVGNSAVLSEIAAMRKEWQEFRESLDEDDEDEGGDIIGKIMDNPMTAAIIGKIFNIQLPAPAKIGAAPGDNTTVEQSINILQLHDAKIVDHLAKLARLAQRSPKEFSFLLSLLDNMNI